MSKVSCANPDCSGTAWEGGSVWCQTCFYLPYLSKFYLIGFCDLWIANPTSKESIDAYEMGVADRLGITDE